MRLNLSLTTLSIAFVLASLGACKKEDPQAQTQAQYPQGYQQQQPAYGQQQPAYGQQQPAYGQQQPAPAYGQPAAAAPAPAAPAAAPAPAAPAAPAPAAATGMNPNPTGLPCQADAQCLTHKCNTTLGKCSFPCQTAADCLAGFQCMTPICVPAAGAPAPAR